MPDMAKYIRPTMLGAIALLPTTVWAQHTNTSEDSTKLKSQRLQEVIVTSHSARQRVETIQIGSEFLNLQELSKTPALFGQNDIMRSIQLLPGVKSENEGSSSFQVRGGTSAQNSIVYDDAPVYNVGHLAGLFSAFNDDALATATLYKGLIPAQYGGATAGYLDINSRSGNSSACHGQASIGLLSAKGTFEAPLSDRGSFLVTARRSYLDLFLKQINDFKDNTLYFYDVNAKASWRWNMQNQLFWSFFASNDKIGLQDKLNLKWSNIATTLSWLHHFQKEGNTSKTSLIYSNYSTTDGVELLGLDISFSGFIRQYGIRQNFRYALGRHQLDMGLQSMVLDVKSAEWRNVNKHEREERKAWENSFWINDTYQLHPKVTASLGFRLGTFSNLGGPHYYEIDEDGNIVWMYKTRKNRIVNTQVTCEPRASLVFMPAHLWSIKAGYTRSAQNIHALRNQNTSTPFDRYTISSNLVKPQVADQVSLGIFAMTPQQTYDFSLEGYFRHVNHVLDYRDGISFSSQIEIERLVLAGEGKGYGLEMCARKNTGKLTGWLSYTLSWSKTRIDGINGGRWYDANNDRRHDIDIVGIYRLNPHWTLHAVWVYNSGQAFTAPSGKYELIDNYIYYYAERNSYRAPANHRMDVSATWSRPIHHGKWTREWIFSIYNLYNRYNPYLIRFEDSADGARTKATQYSLFGIVPSVAFTIKF